MYQPAVKQLFDHLQPSQMPKVASLLAQALRHAIRAGELLVEAKSRVQHGEWGSWVEANFEGSTRTTQAYMKVAREIPNLDEVKAQRVALLSLREAMRELSTPKIERILGDWTDCRDFDELNQKADAVARGEAWGDGEWSVNAWYQLSKEDRRTRAGWFREIVIQRRVYAAYHDVEPDFDHWRGQLLMLERIVRPIDIPIGREFFGLLDRLSGAQCLKTIAQLDDEGVFPLGGDE